MIYSQRILIFKPGEDKRKHILRPVYRIGINDGFFKRTSQDVTGFHLRVKLYESYSFCLFLLSLEGHMMGFPKLEERNITYA